MHNISTLPGYLTKLALLALALSLLACEKFEYSPYEVRLNEDEKNINHRNIEKIKALNVSPEEPLQFILTADSQSFYEENEKLVNHVNQNYPDAHFLLLGGDITDFGLLKEFRLVNNDLKRLNMPYVAVVGNHDAINNGKEVYRAMFGDFDLSFVVGNSKFILLNTNYLEFDKKVPNLDWLEAELKDGKNYDHVFVLSHIPPSSNEFGKEKSAIYGQLLSQYNASFSLHGHTHAFKYYYPFDGRVPYLISGPTERLEYTVFTVVGDKISFEQVSVNGLNQ